MNSDEAIVRAREIANERGWTWQEPVNVTVEGFLGRKSLHVWSNANSRGCNVSIRFDAETGALQDAHFAPR